MIEYTKKYKIVNPQPNVYICYDEYNNDDLKINKQYKSFLNEQGFEHFKKEKDVFGSYSFVRKII